MQNHRKFAFGPSSIKSQNDQFNNHLLSQAYKIPNRDGGSRNQGMRQHSSGNAHHFVSAQTYQPSSTKYERHRRQRPKSNSKRNSYGLYKERQPEELKSPYGKGHTEYSNLVSMDQSG